MCWIDMGSKEGTLSFTLSFSFIHGSKKIEKVYVFEGKEEAKRSESYFLTIGIGCLAQ